MQDNNSLNKKTMSNIAWSFAEKIGAQGVTFLVSIVLARMLDPNTYGVIAVVMVITAILQVFVDCGVSEALIQKKQIDDTDFSSMFYFNVLMCVSIYLVLYTMAPFISVIYKNKELIPVVRVLGLSIIVYGIKNIQSAYVRRNLMFKKFFYSTLIGTVFAAAAGIYMAYKGFGVWALVTQHLFNNVIDTLVLWVTVKWRPKLLFSFNRLRILLSYGYKILLANLLVTLYDNSRSLIIGAMYTPSDLAFYNQGEKYPKFAVDNINASIDSVLLTSMSSEQENKERVKNMTRRAIKTSSFIIAPVMFGMIAISKPLILILLTDKWIKCVPYFIIFCISYSFYPVHTANLNAIKAVGRSDLILKQEGIKKAFEIVILIFTMWFGPLIMAISRLITTFISLIVNSYPNTELINYKYSEQIKDLLPNFSLAIIMAVIVYIISYINLNIYLTIIIQIIVGGIIYVSGALILKNDSLIYLLKIGKNYIKK